MELKGKILIVDDEPINLDFFDVMLSNLGFQVEKAEDGEEALERVQETSPDLIILDNIMPKLTGWEVTKILKNEEAYADYRDVPIIMFSAMDDVRDKIEGFELGVEDYITKPFNFSEVLARIRAVLRNRALSGQLVRRERKLTLIESLNQSLIYFTDHLEKPVVALLNAAQSIPTDDPKQVEQFAAQVRSECEQTLAALKGLQEEVAELQNEGEKIKQSELSIRDLDQKFQKHFQNLREQQENFNEVSG